MVHPSPQMVVKTIRTRLKGRFVMSLFSISKQKLQKILVGIAIVALPTVGMASIASAAATLTFSSNPVVSGFVTVGQTLTTTTGTAASGTPGYTYTEQWYNCTGPVSASSTVPGSCTSIATATGTTYTLTTGDRGTYVTVAVTATDSLSATGVEVAAQTVMTTDALTYSTNPAFTTTGSNVGVPMTVNSGTINAGTSVTTETTPASYQWYACGASVTASTTSGAFTAPNGCNAISGATAATYSPTSNVVQNTVYVTAAVTSVANVTTNSQTAQTYLPITYVVGQTTPLTVAPVSFGSFSGSAVPATSPSPVGVGSTLTAPTVIWSGSPGTLPGSTTYQWYDCNAQVSANSATLPASPVTCSPIANATSSTYVVVGADVPSYVLVKITNANSISSASEFSASTTTSVISSPPTAASVPTIDSVITAGTTITGTAGTFNAGVPATENLSYQWYRCSSAVNNSLTTLQGPCAQTSVSGPIAGATSTTYVLQAADVGKYVVFSVTDSNGVLPSPTAYSASSQLITGSAPNFVSGPTFNYGSLNSSPLSAPTPGVAVTATTGTWTGSTTPSSFTYQWYSCPSSTTSYSTGAGQSVSSTTVPGCTPISGASGTSTPTFTPTTAFSGQLLLVLITDNNGIGTTQMAISVSTPAVASPSAPTVVSPSTMTEANGTFTATSGVFGGIPVATVTSETWYLCSTNNGNAASQTVPSVCTGVGYGQVGTGLTYTPTAAQAQAGDYLTVGITASNGTAITSYAIPVALTLAAPVETAPPVITGSPTAGSTLTASTGTWTALPAPVFTYSWYACSSPVNSSTATLPGGCTPVGGNSSSYSPTASLATTFPYIIVGVTADNHSSTYSPSGTATWYSVSTSAVTATAPNNVSPPTVPASASTSAVMAASPGTWTGSPAPTFTYQWYYCSSSVSYSGTLLPTGCYYIPGTNPLLSTYQPSGTYVNDYFLVGVTGSNGVTSNGSVIYVTVFSASTQTPLTSTLSITGLAISGTAAVGTALTSSATVTSAASYATSYQWYQCSSPVLAGTSVPLGCAAISGATSYSFGPTATQVGYYLTIAESVSNSSGSAIAVAPSTALVTTSVPGAPTNVFGIAGVGSATVYWTAPTSGLAVTSYTVTSSPAGGSCTSTTTTCVVSGLLRTASYTFTVVASNNYGSSTASVASAAVTPSATTPAAPTNVTAVGGNLSATVTWSAANANGAVITGYVVSSSPAGGSCSVTTTTCLITGLSNGTPYTFTVTASNALGTSVSSLASAAVTPAALIPSAPTGVSTLAKNGTIAVHWTAAVSNGSTITGYLVTVTLGTVSKTCTTTGLTCSVSGLANGKTYSVTLVAQSANGSSSPSPAAVTHLLGVPTAAGYGAFVKISGGFILNLRPAASNGGLVVKYYQYSLNGGVSWMKSKSMNSLKLTVTGLLHRHLYRVVVRAVNVAGPGPKSGVKLVFTA